MSSNVVVIPLERYEQLLNLETRVSVIIEKLNQDKYMENDELLLILGTEESIKLLDEMRNKKRSYDMSFARMLGDSK